MPMDILSVKVKRYKPGILEDAVEVEITRCMMSYGLAGPPITTNTGWFKFMVGKEEVMKRMQAFAGKGEQPIYEVESLPYPPLQSTFNHLGRHSILAQIEEMKSAEEVRWVWENYVGN